MNTMTRFEMRPGDVLVWDQGVGCLTISRRGFSLTVYLSDTQRWEVVSALGELVERIAPQRGRRRGGPAEPGAVYCYLYPKADGRIHASRRVGENLVVLFIFDKDEANGGLTIAMTESDAARMLGVVDSYMTATSVRRTSFLHRLVAA